MNRSRLTAQLKEDEGVIEHAYTDSEGYLTIGVGRLIDRIKGGKLSEDEIDLLLNNDINQVAHEARDFHWYLDLNEVRANVVLNMIFNLGLTGFKNFKLMIKAIERHDFEDASREMLDSKWAGQVGRRALRLSEEMRKGEW